MRKRMIFIVSIVLMVCLFMIATPGPYDDYAAEITGLITDLAPIVLLVIAAALGLAAGVLVVRIGYRWVRGFLRGA